MSRFTSSQPNTSEKAATQPAVAWGEVPISKISTLKFAGLRLRPGTVTVIYAFPGTGKSYMQNHALYSLRLAHKVSVLDTDLFWTLLHLNRPHLHRVRTSLRPAIGAMLNAVLQHPDPTRATIIFTNAWDMLQNAGIEPSVIVLPSEEALQHGYLLNRPDLDATSVRAWLRSPALRSWVGAREERLITLGRGEYLSDRVCVLKANRDGTECGFLGRGSHDDR